MSSIPDFAPEPKASDSVVANPARSKRPRRLTVSFDNSDPVAARSKRPSPLDVSDPAADLAANIQRVNTLRVQIAGLNEPIMYWTKKLSETNDSIVCSLKGQLAEKSDLICDLKAQLAEKSGLISDLRAQVAEKSDLICNLREQLENKTLYNILDE